jgi:hypothetical protein
MDCGWSFTRIDDGRDIVVSEVSAPARSRLRGTGGNVMAIQSKSLVMGTGVAWAVVAATAMFSQYFVAQSTWAAPITRQGE